VGTQLGFTPAAAPTGGTLRLFIPPARPLLQHHKLLVVSGHHNTQLGLLAALELDKYAPAASSLWLKQAPTFGAVLVLELHRDPTTNAYSVRMVYQVNQANIQWACKHVSCQHGSSVRARAAVTCNYLLTPGCLPQNGPGSNYTVIPLPCASEEGGKVRTFRAGRPCLAP
jgi:hypothetical protein